MNQKNYATLSLVFLQLLISACYYEPLEKQTGIPNEEDHRVGISPALGLRMGYRFK